MRHYLWFHRLRLMVQPAHPPIRDRPSDVPGEWIKAVEVTVADTKTRHFKRTAPGRSRFSSLPGAHQEALDVSNRFGMIAKNEPRCVLQGAYATEGLVRVLAPGRRILHLATHGHIDSKLPSALERRSGVVDPDAVPLLSASMERYLVGYDPMLLAYVVLAGFNRQDGGGDDDGAITALEAASLNLDGVELVVLSACDTAGGAVRSGEGVLGLVRGFKQAGAQLVVASLWPVDDMATMLFMEYFYSDILSGSSGQPPAKALRWAAQALRRYELVRHEEEASKVAGRDVVVTVRPVDAPRHWAAFVAYGPIR